MFGKFFASAFEGSMYGAGADVFAVWSYVISHTVNSRVEINPVAVAPKIGMTVDRVEKALEYLCAPDLKSRSKEYDGSRMVKEGEYAYLIPNHRAYLLIKSSQDLREYNARKQREHRERKKKGECGDLRSMNGKPLPGEMAYVKAVEEGDDEMAERMLRTAGEMAERRVEDMAEQMRRELGEAPPSLDG